MFRIRFTGRLALLLLVAGLYPTLALALNEAFEGFLEPHSYDDPKIPVVVQLRDLAVILHGTVKTSTPSPGVGPIEGENALGRCTIDVNLSPTLSLRMIGSCDPTSYSGNYSMWDAQKKTINRGTFNLSRMAPETAELEHRRGASVAGCLKANTACLVACPRTDESAEFVCSNRCRAKLKTCKSHVSKPPPPT